MTTVTVIAAVTENLPKPIKNVTVRLSSDLTVAKEYILVAMSPTNSKTQHICQV